MRVKIKSLLMKNNSATALTNQINKVLFDFQLSSSRAHFTQGPHDGTDELRIHDEAPHLDTLASAPSRPLPTGSKSHGPGLQGAQDRGLLRAGNGGAQSKIRPFEAGGAPMGRTLELQTRDPQPRASGLPQACSRPGPRLCPGAPSTPARATPCAPQSAPPSPSVSHRDPQEQVAPASAPMASHVGGSRPPGGRARGQKKQEADADSAVRPARRRPDSRPARGTTDAADGQLHTFPLRPVCESGCVLRSQHPSVPRVCTWGPGGRPVTATP